MGIIFAFTAVLFWGFGDFLIEKSTRKMGDMVSLFYISLVGIIILSPFVYKDIFFSGLSISNLALLSITTLITLVAALLVFESLRQGKISVVEPLFATELFATLILSVLIIKEFPSALQIFSIFAILSGIFLVSVKSKAHLKAIKWEKGILFAVLGSMAMGATNFMVGISSRNTNPLLTNWFISVGLTLITLVYLVYKKRSHELILDGEKNKKLIFAVSFIDNGAWVAFAYSTIYLPISVAAGITESYIVLAALLGLFYNKEKLKLHQYFGMVMVIIFAIILASNS
jgi:drug/metabolite transporter (DMT)-like permease